MGCDMSCPGCFLLRSGLIAAGIGSNPFEHCDVFMTTSHKTLRGPRGAFIIFRKGVRSVTKSGEGLCVCVCVISTYIWLCLCV